MAKISKVYRFLVYALPAVLFFSYYPVISLGASESMNFEFSLPLIWLMFFDVVAFVIMVQKKYCLRNASECGCGCCSLFLQHCRYYGL